VKGLSYTLLGDGSSDQLLKYPVRWALRTLGVPVELSQWADLRQIRSQPSTQYQRVLASLNLYPADLLIFHRDADGAGFLQRVDEIRRAMGSLTQAYVAAIPVRMTEAWLLHDEAAIRRASGNPNGTSQLALPPPARVEQDTNPKATLRTALLQASELRGARRSRKERDFGTMRTRTAELIEDFGALRQAPAFANFLATLDEAVDGLGYRRDVRRSHGL